MKGGVVNLTRQVAVDFAKHGIVCNAIAPGKILTPREGGRRSRAPSYAHARTPVAAPRRARGRRRPRRLPGLRRLPLHDGHERARRRRLHGVLSTVTVRACRDSKTARSSSPAAPRASGARSASRSPPRARASSSATCAAISSTSAACRPIRLITDAGGVARFVEADASQRRRHRPHGRGRPRARRRPPRRDRQQRRRQRARTPAACSRRARRTGTSCSDVGLRGVFLCCQRAVRQMLTQEPLRRGARAGHQHLLPARHGRRARQRSRTRR